MADFLKAGLDSWRWRCQIGPSLTNSPLPAKLLPGKKAVPSCADEAYSMDSCYVWLEAKVNS